MVQHFGSRAFSFGVKVPGWFLDPWQENAVLPSQKTGCSWPWSERSAPEP